MKSTQKDLGEFFLVLRQMTVWLFEPVVQVLCRMEWPEESSETWSSLQEGLECYLCISIPSSLLEFTRCSINPF
jgi:hypothetical protein